MRVDIKAGKTPPITWDDKRPWDWVFGALISDNEFWHSQVHGPALAWMASGSKGTPRTPAEMVAIDYLQGGVDAINPAVEPPKAKPSRSSRSRNRRRARRDARKKRAAEDKAEFGQVPFERGRKRQERPESAEVFQLEQWGWSLLAAAA